MGYPTKLSTPRPAPDPYQPPLFILTESRLKPTFYQRSFGSLKASLRNFAIVTAAILGVNVGWLVWAQSKYGTEGGHRIIQQGDCASAKRTSVLLHLLINILSSILLAASTAFVQAYSSPSRAEVDAAHQRRQWLHIGTMSWRNLRGINRRKAAVCILLTLSSIPFHLLYNSLVFVSVTTSNYMSVGVTPDFFEDAPIEHPSASWSLCESCISQSIENLSYLRDLPGSWERLEPAECIKTYSDFFQNRRRHVFLVSSDRNTTNSLWYENSNYAQVDDRSFFWMCSKDETGGPSVTCSPEDLITKIHKGGVWQVHEHTISHCLSERVEGECAVRFHYGIMVAVLTFNSMKLILMLFIIYRFSAEHLLTTIGDAVVSFLRYEDLTTRYMCLVSGQDFERPGYAPQLARVYTGQQHRWYRGATKRRWRAFISLLFLSLATIVIFLGWGLHVLRSKAVETSIQGLWSLGLGTVDARAMVSLDPNTNTAGMAMLANVPQLFLAAIYIVFNPVVSLMFSANWWASLASAPRSLVVSSPSAQQTSPPLLGASFGWGLTLLALHSVLHWLCSQSLFLVYAQVFDSAKDVQLPPKLAASWAGCGYSPIGAIFTIVASAALLIIAVALGCRKLAAPAPPLVRNCSAAISASCHLGQDVPLPGDEEVINQIQWGALRGWVWPDGGGHCSIVPAQDDNVLSPIDNPYIGVHYA